MTRNEVIRLGGCWLKMAADIMRYSRLITNNNDRMMIEAEARTLQQCAFDLQNDYNRNHRRGVDVFKEAKQL